MKVKKINHPRHEGQTEGFRIVLLQGNVSIMNLIVSFRLRLFSHVPTCIAFSVMHRNRVAAGWAPIHSFLIFQELVHTYRLQHFQVFNHAHAVAFPVAIVKVGEVLAGHSVAFKAVFDLVVG